MSVTTLDVRDVADDELIGLYRADPYDDATREAVLAEAKRRDRAERLAKGRQRIYAEWYDAAYAQYQAADIECRGELVNDAPGWPVARGDQPGRDDFALWTLPERDAMRFATEELKDFWRANPRLSFRQWQRQRAASEREARQDARQCEPVSDDDLAAWADKSGPAGLAVTEGTSNEQHAKDSAGLGGHEAAGLRRVGAADPVRRERSGLEHARAEAGRVRDPGPVRQPGRRVMDTAVTGTALVPRAGGTVARTPRQVPGDQLLDVVRQWLGTYARYPSPAALDAVTLWVAHAHCRDKDGVLVFRATPRLYLLSSEPGSGKSRVLELLGMLCPATFGLDLEPSAAGLVYTIAREHATVLIDEGDILFGAGARKAAVRAIINGGYTRHGTYLNGKGAKASRVPVFGALAIAGLDVMEKGTGDTLNALMSRGVKIRMRKAGGSDRPAKVTRVTEGQAVKLAAWLAAWAAQERDGLADADPQAPEEVDGRTEQIWSPLLAIADTAGGDWPERARAACLELALAAGSFAEEEPVADQLTAFAASLGAGLEYADDDGADDGADWAAEPGAEWDWEDEAPAPVIEASLNGGDAAGPLPAASPVQDPPQVTYAAWMAVSGRQPQQLASRITDPALAQIICQETPEAKVLAAQGQRLRWELDGRGGYRAGNSAIAFVIAPAAVREAV